MVFKNNIPQSSDFISQSQKDMIGNFETIDSSWGKQGSSNENIGDHVSLKDDKLDNQGMHKKLTLVEQGSEPAPSTNEITLFSQDTSGKPEIYYRRDGDASGYQLTSSGKVSVGGLVLQAFVVFDFQGNILEREELDEDGNTIKVPMKLNVASVTANQPLVNGGNLYGDWNINFTNALPTDNFIWDYRAFSDSSYSNLTTKVVQAQPYSSATYSDTVSTTRFRAFSTNISPDGTTVTPAGPVIGRLERMVFHAYTVA